MIEVKNLSRTYGKGAAAVHALRDINLTIEEGDFISIIGKSGCGKSTFLNILGGIALPTKGEYRFDENLVSQYSESKLSAFRNQNLGFVVQHFALISDMTVYENIALPLRYKKYTKRQIDKRVNRLLEEMELIDKSMMYPYELSGGQCQRVAIARAIAGKPKLLLADEPTGSLDEDTGNKILKILKKLNKTGMTLIIVTHDKEVASQAKKIIEMKDGKIINALNEGVV